MKLDRDKVIRAREVLGYGIEKAAEEAGVSKNSVLRAEHEEDIRPQTARKIAAALGVRVADLIAEPEYPLEGAPPSQQLTLNGVLDEERRLQYLRAFEDFMRHTSARWHARITEHESLDLPLEPAWVEELENLHLELALVVIHGLLRDWDEAVAPVREKNLMKAIARALDYLGEVTTEAFRKTQTPGDGERYQQRQAELQRAADEIQARMAG